MHYRRCQKLAKKCVTLARHASPRKISFHASCAGGGRKDRGYGVGGQCFGTFSRWFGDARASDPAVPFAGLSFRAGLVVRYESAMEWVATIYDLRSTIYDLRSTIYDLRSTIYDPRSTIYDPRSTIYDARSKSRDVVLSVEVQSYSCE